MQRISDMSKKNGKKCFSLMKIGMLKVIKMDLEIYNNQKTASKFAQISISNSR